MQNNSLEIAETLTTDHTTVGSIPYWSGLINGLGRYSSNTHSLLRVFKVKPNTAYRFRLIGAQGHYAYRVEIVGHKMTVITTDGYFVRPTEVDYIIIHTGERYDFILNATQTPNNYLIRAQTL
jgi:FtsP/CotA-like multicopper oxidase with cupredoxin domain